ncbi:SDR family NAD(P)-dependent oxidoreductase [Garicola koreensis]|uniref:NAD(P)-dependent dehydrogenase (Short-subunit alcohol dehydrogenase family) n=1 Tax=Garicola koreensis TaxID=1262554 RepID=A0A7W5Y0L1_9MICC|nr:SDR family oxidoreductase [Garicola koreensis]MBB3667343.1 NAD(P)-dependent dehydrogenase (short-subunit alcohol dehydrogenase family) [Garicola koreensis]
MDQRDQKGTYSDLFRLDGRRALIIGAGGIGAEAARALSDHGALITCADRDGDAAQAAAAAVGGQSAELDITDSEAVRHAAESLPEVDVVVLTAAMNVRKRILDYSPEEFDRVVDLNLRGTFSVIKYFGEKMVERGRGSIIIFSSIRDQVVEPGQSVYAATKAGAVQLVKTAAAEFGELGVRVNAVSPGVVETRLTSQIKSDPQWHQAYAAKSALGRWSLPAELAGAVVYLASDAASYVTGTTLRVDGGWTAVDGRFTPPA